jgi:predicted O-methyltransferase YrrM
MSDRTLALTDSLYDYILAHSVREAPILAQLRQATASLPGASMQISPEQGQLMALLIKLTGARRCIEVGTYTGYSSLAVALALPPDGTIVACDTSVASTDIARRFWREAGVEARIELHLRPALATLEVLLAEHGRGTFDFAFIDADKTNYLAYYEMLVKLIRPGGLIAVDNTLWGGQVADSRCSDDDTVALRAFNDQVHRDERVDLSLVPIGDGLTLLRIKP